METATSTIRFVTEQGADVPAVDSTQMREVDRIAVEETGPNLYQMMENAGRNLALLAIRLLDEGWQRAKVLTSGQTPGVFVSPRWTLTLGLLPRFTGDLCLGDIGIPGKVCRRIGINYVMPIRSPFMGPAQKW